MKKNKFNRSDDQDSLSRAFTLNQILLFMVTVTLLILLLGNLLLNIHNTRNYLQQQLYSNAANTATSLALSLSTTGKGRDLVTAGSMMDAIFDGGYYRYLIYRNVKGDVLLNRSSTGLVKPVPAWFVSWIDLKPQKAVAQVVNGWRQLGTLEVESKRSYAYKELWSALKAQIVWFIAVAIIATLLLRSALVWVLMPLRRIERQAKAIAEHDFEVRIPDTRIRELRQVALGMNSMAEKLGEIFSTQVKLIEQLRQDKFRDSLTGLGNRLDFDQRIKSELSSEQSVAMGMLFLVQIGRFSEYNQKMGRAEGDQLLVDAGKILREECAAIGGSLLARRSGSEFGIFLPGLLADVASEMAERLLKKLSLIRTEEINAADLPVHIGVSVSYEGVSPEKLLFEADLALRQAQESGADSWRLNLNNSPKQEGLNSAAAWQNVLRQAIETADLSQFFQPVFDGKGEKVLYYQVLSRLFVKGNWVSAARFIPMAERFGLLPDLDRLMVQNTLVMLKQFLHESLSSSGSKGFPRLCLTLSSQTLLKSNFVSSIIEMLQEEKELCPKLIFELPEFGLVSAMEAWQDFMHITRSLGCQFSIDRIGVAGVPFSYLETMPLDTLKVDRSYIREIQQFPDKQFFIRSIMQIAHSRGIKVIAVGVEDEKELDVLKKLEVDGLLGYLLARPQKELIQSEMI